MKKFILFALVSFVICLNAFASMIVTLEQDKDNYHYNDRAVLISHVNIFPENENYEYFLESFIDNVPQKIVKITDSEWALVTDKLQNDQYLWNVKVYLQDKAFAEEVGSTIALNNQKICNLKTLILLEKNSSKILKLENEIQDLTDLNTLIEEQLIQSRILVEDQSKNLIIVSRSLQADRFLMNINSDKIDDVFEEGEYAKLSISIISGFVGKELVLRGDYEGQELAIDQISALGFKTTTPMLSASNVGIDGHKLTFKLYIRDFDWSVSKRDAIAKADSMRRELINQKNAEKNDAMKLYYQEQINDLSMIINALYSILNDALEIIEQTNYFIHIVGDVGDCDE